MLELLKGATPLQKLGVIILFNGTVVGGTAALTQMGIPAGAVQAMSAFCGLANVFLGGLVTMFGGPNYMKDTVGRLPGTTVVTDAKSAAALPDNKDVVAATPEIVAAIKKAQ